MKPCLLLSLILVALWAGGGFAADVEFDVVPGETSGPPGPCFPPT